jgi:hypothetical protein
MSKQGFKTYCKIIHYVEAVNPMLAELLRYTCVDGTLSSMRGKEGITFLMPSETLTKEIQTLAWSDIPEEADRACDMLNACILSNYYHSPASFKSDRPVINCLWPSQIVKVEKTDNKGTVYFEGKATAVLDEKFKQMRDEKKNPKSKGLAVWKLEGALIPTTGAVAQEKDKVMPRRTKEGRYEPELTRLAGIRFKIMLYVEQAYAHDRVQMCNGLVSHVSTMPYCAYTASLMMYLKANDPGTYVTVLPIIAFDNFDFYALIEPHSDEDKALVSTGHIEAWLKTAATNISPAECVANCKQIMDDMDAVGGKKQAVLAAIDAERRKLTDATSATVRRCVEHIETVYGILESKNMIGGVSDVLPADLFEYYKRAPGTKMLHDDIRYLTYLRFKQLERRGSFNFDEFNALVNFIGDAMHANNAKERDSNRGILNKIRIKNMIAPTMERDEIICFLNSTMFLSIAITQKDMPHLGRHVTTKPTPGKIVLFNIHADIYEKFDRFSNIKVEEQISAIGIMTQKDRELLALELAKWA